MSSLLGNRASSDIFGILVALQLYASACIVGPSRAHGAEHEIQTRANQWVPVVLFVEPGDTVVWRGMTGHETALIEMMGPADVTVWNSGLDEEGFSVTLDVAGAYIYKCDIHLNAGMVGAIVVGGGEPHNLEALALTMRQINVGRNFVQRVFARLRREVARRRNR